LRYSTPARLRNAYLHAASNGYILGVKLVRGAYHPQEIEHHIQHSANKDSPPPVWSEKHETDQCYNECAGLLLDNISRSISGSASATSGVLFGTHNKESCDLILDGLVKRGLATLDQNSGTLKVPEATAAQVHLGQLLGTFFYIENDFDLNCKFSGMADELTNYVSCRLDSDTPMVLKCIPYAKLEDVRALHISLA
jgi:proline dehydrogenase